MSAKPNKKDQLKQIRDEIWDLKESPLYEERTKNNAYPVIGEGDHDANIMFIGEAPGKKEAATGKPFCGMSGRILDELLEHIKMPRETVYITNIVKDRPTNNRDPKKDEIELYAPFLDRQIEILRPKVIATLGRFSMEYIMNRYGLADQIEPISKIHGQIFDAKLGDYEFKFVPLYHPAVSVYNRNTLPDLKKDFEILVKYK
jgi:uracil-DNA glycosylase family 4